MKPRKDAADRGAGSGCMARLVRLSSFAGCGLLPALARVWLLFVLKHVFFIARIVNRADVLRHIVEVRHILSDEKAWKCIACGPVGLVGGNSADNLNAVSAIGVSDRPTTDAVDGDAVDQVSIPVVLPGRDVPAEEAKSPRLNSGKSHPTDLTTEADLPLTWEEGYKLLWERKIALMKKNHSGVGLPVCKNHSLSLLQK